MRDGLPGQRDLRGEEGGGGSAASGGGRMVIGHVVGLEKVMCGQITTSYPYSITES